MEGRTIFMQMPGCETVLVMTVTTLKVVTVIIRTKVKVVTVIIRTKVVTVIVRTVSQPGICMKIVSPSPTFSPRNDVTTNLRLGTVYWFLVFDYVLAEVAKYERSMWKILVRLEKFAKVSESLITFLLNWKKTVKFQFDVTLHTVSRGQIRPGTSDRTQSDNISLDRVSV